MFLLNSQCIVLKSNSGNEFFAQENTALNITLKTFSSGSFSTFLSCHSRYCLKTGMTEKHNFLTEMLCIWLNVYLGWNADNGCLQARLQFSSQPCVRMRTLMLHKQNSVNSAKSRTTSLAFIDKRNWDSIQGLNMKGQEGPNENLNNFEPREKLSYILSVLGASRG